MIHEIVIKNVHIKKQRTFFAFMGEVHLAQRQVLLRQSKSVSLQSCQETLS